MAGESRFAELEPGIDRVAVLALRSVAIAVIIGGSGSFLLTLASMLTVQESFSSLDAAGDLDAASRLCIAISSLAIVAGGIGFGLADLGDSATLILGLARRHERAPQIVAPFHQRRRVLERSHFSGIRVALWILFGVALFAALLGIFFLVDESDPGFGLAILAISLTVAIVCVLPQAWLNRGGPVWWKRRRLELAGAWNRFVTDGASASEAAARLGPLRVLHQPHRRWRVAPRYFRNAVIVIFLAAAAVGFAGVFLRQPCKRCEPRYFDQPIENVIDVLIVVGAALVALGLLAFVALVLVFGITILLRRIELARALRVDGTLKPSAIRDDVLGRSSLDTAAIGLLSLAVALALIGGSLAAVVSQGRDALPYLTWIVAALVVPGVALATAGNIAGPRYRNSLRLRFSPGDVRFDAGSSGN